MTFQLKAGSGSVNLGDTFGSTLANIGAFVAANKGSGTSVAITSVTYSAVTKLYTVTLTAGAGYVVGQTLKFNLNTVTALTVLLISYYEGKEIEIVMT
jgi:glucosamine 6-phosphate synthetase-like amidotransferase/phosphosugar isomerase protein